MATRVYYLREGQTGHAFKMGVVSSDRTKNNTYVRAHSHYTGNQSLLSQEMNVPLRSTTMLNNRVYSRVINNLRSDSASGLTALAEMRSSIDMIGNRAVQMYSSYRAMRRGDILKAFHILHSEPSRGVKTYVEGKFSTRRPQRLSSVWLEYWMGWAPSVADVNNAAAVLSSPPPQTQKIRGGASDFNSIRIISGNPQKPVPFIGYSVGQGEVKTRSGFYAKATLVNENLFLAQSLGLVNPALTVWEVTPFSWLVDWSFNVGQFLSAFTDTAGVTLNSSGYGTKTERRADKFGTDAHPTKPSHYEVRGSAEHFARNPGGLNPPQLTVQVPHLSLTRAATAVSLLSQVLDGHRDSVMNRKLKLELF